MAVTYIPYTTIEGDRWDNLANRAYGDPMLYGIITAANPYVPITDIIPGGTELVIPITAAGTSGVDSSLLPPWKQ